VVQTFSNSVAYVMEFYMNNLKLPEFQGAEATIKFCHIFNYLFDILNIRNVLSKNTYNKNINHTNKKSTIQFIKEGIEYIEKLNYYKKNSYIIKTKLFLQSNRRTGFEGFIVNLKILINLTYELITNNYLKYILSYKFS
jgi:hypothetical protein